MKRYIRTKDGKILESATKYKGWTIVIDGVIREFLTESNNIFDLIQVGDLVKSYIVGLEEHIFELSSDIDLEEAKQENVIITQLYTKQGNNYILVWDKERGII